jgi:hypothetical protein
MTGARLVIIHGRRHSRQNAKHIREWMTQTEHPRGAQVEMIRDWQRRGFLTPEDA